MIDDSGFGLIMINIFKSKSYAKKMANEIGFYKDCDDVHALPEIFHYWSNKYLLPKFQPHGFISPDDFFKQKTFSNIIKNPFRKQHEILSIGSGNGDAEISLAQGLIQKGIYNFNITCLDINPYMLERCKQQAKAHQLEKHISTLCVDFNLWKAKMSFDIIIANQCLHHVLALEHLYNQIYKGLSNTGVFLVSDMIGRNGHQRWPEALKLLEPIWSKLPTQLKYNQLLKRYEESYINHDCSGTGFEGIRAQEVLPLLVARFNFDLFIPFANIIMVLIDRPFGHNYDIDNNQHIRIIDETHRIDEEAILNGIIKPTQMLAALSKQNKQSVLIDPLLTPEFCIRNHKKTPLDVAF